jgi:hypothetical protein
MARMPMTPYGFKLRPVDEVVAAAQAQGLNLYKHARVGQRDQAAHLLAFARRG